MMRLIHRASSLTVCSLFRVPGQAEADQTNHHFLPVLQRRFRHPAVHRRGRSRTGHPRGGLDRPV